MLPLTAVDDSRGPEYGSSYLKAKRPLRTNETPVIKLVIKMTDRSNLLKFYSPEAALKYKKIMESPTELDFYRTDVAELTLKLFVSNLPVLDVGCGCGDVLNLVSQSDGLRDGTSLMGVYCRDDATVEHAKKMCY